jgi:hypothetical protein
MRREPGGLAYGSLRRWAMADSPEGYEAHAAVSRREIVIDALSGTHYDIAKLVYTMYKDEFVCSSLGNKKFYQFKSHKWVKLDEGHALRSRISTAVFSEIKRIVADLCGDEAGAPPGGGGGDGDDKKKDYAKRVLESLKNTNHKNNILTECAELFYRPNFEQELDEKTHLLGFNKGSPPPARRCKASGRIVSILAGIDYGHGGDAS